MSPQPRTKERAGYRSLPTSRGFSNHRDLPKEERRRRDPTFDAPGTGRNDAVDGGGSDFDFDFDFDM